VEVKKIKIICGGVGVEAELFETKLASEIQKILPIESEIETWGDEIYFPIPVDAIIENPTLDVSVGDLAYWRPQKCFCIFYGKTPASTNDKPAPASEVEVFGKIIEGAEKLRNASARKITINDG